MDLCVDTSVSVERAAPIFRAETGFLQIEVTCSSETLVSARIAKINRLTLFKEIIYVYFENRMKHINALCRQNAEFMNVEMVAHLFTPVL
jgi:hypothetical protein